MSNNEITEVGYSVTSINWGEEPIFENITEAQIIVQEALAGNRVTGRTRKIFTDIITRRIGRLVSRENQLILFTGDDLFYNPRGKELNEIIYEILKKNWQPSRFKVRQKEISLQEISEIIVAASEEFLRE